MPFDAEGFRRAARVQGFSEPEINQVIAEKTGVKGWLTGGKQGLGGAVNAAGEILNLPSYAVGGMLDRAQNQGTQALNPLKNPFGIPAAIEGIRDKKPVMQELPEGLGIDPYSAPGLALGFAGELATPDPISLFSGASKLIRGADNADELGLFARGARRAGGTLDEQAQMRPFRGLGRSKTTERMLSQLNKSGMTSDEFMDAHKLWSRSADDANQAISKVDDLYKKAVFESGGNVRTVDVVGELNKQIENLRPAARQSRSAQAQLARLEEARDAFLRSVQEGGATPLNVPLGRVAEAKSYVTEDIPQSYFNLGSSQTGYGRGAELARRTYKNIVDKATQGDTARLGAQESALINYRDLLRSKEVAERGNMNLPFTKLIAPGAGGLAAGVPGAVGAYGLQTAANSPRGIAAQTKALRGVGRTLQKPSVLKGIDRGASAAGRAARTGFRVSQQPSRRFKSRQKIGATPQLQQPRPQSLVSSQQNSFPTATQIRLFTDLERKKRRIF